MNKRVTVIALALTACVLGLALALSANASGQPASARPLGINQNPQWGPDIQVNPSPAVTPSGETNFSMAINPINPNQVIAGWDSDEPGHNPSAHGTSIDGGLTWHVGWFDKSWGADNLTPGGDTRVAFDARGVGYYSTAVQGNTTAGYVVLTTTNGVDWSTPVPAILEDYSHSISQADLAVDPRASGLFAGNLYMFWQYLDNVSPYIHGIQMRYSTDGAATWSQDVQVSDPANNFGYSPSAAVASDGSVYVGFTEVDSGTILSPPKLYLDKSTDGGTTWGTDNLITGAPIVPIGRPDFKGRELTLLGDANCTLIHINHNVSIGVSPTDPNTVYAVWNDGRWEPESDLCSTTGHHSDIAFTYTTDSGQTWAAPIKVNDDATGTDIDHFQPTLTVRADGKIGVTWYDRRYSTDPGHFMYDLAYSESDDGGLTWSTNTRVSDASSDPDQLQDLKGVDDLGDRRSLVYGPDYALPSWTNARPASQEGDFFTDHGVYGAPTPTPTVTATPTVCTVTFSDVPSGSTFYPYVECLACKGIVSGYDDGTFRPNNFLTRGQLSKMVSNAANFQEDPGPQKFQDVPSTDTFYPYINRLANRGFMSGYQCGGPDEPCVPPQNLPYFRPYNNATRGQISKIVVNTAVSVLSWTLLNPTSSTFQDVPVGSTFFRYIETAFAHNVVGGYPCGSPPAGECVPPDNKPYFLPNNNATRGQTSKVISITFFPECSPARR